MCFDSKTYVYYSKGWITTSHQIIFLVFGGEGGGGIKIKNLDKGGG